MFVQLVSGKNKATTEGTATERSYDLQGQRQSFCLKVSMALAPDADGTLTERNGRA
jgi:hypothetical protein